MAGKERHGSPHTHRTPRTRIRDAFCIKLQSTSISFGADSSCASGGEAAPSSAGASSSSPLVLASFSSSFSGEASSFGASLGGDGLGSLRISSAILDSSALLVSMSAQRRTGFSNFWRAACFACMSFSHCSRSLQAAAMVASFSPAMWPNLSPGCSAALR
eukprot:CAMPEP_0195027810 /NCGR_PEP_ID=MMETSP0326_2-20130528/53066_1 /TAXON_ID=2866 ORGANISM="Crypthecodinium cohnii, Strain Seligo" /NCGR_SAMPLE_ID=MMETSP0326_2 /ASSEMBLY_ACC=CAM_ASM_000348 /LENGTH=159 /DNA_ID=CAMNT_0040050115 /DNA_START=29 /DNA_END=508 /DNA_ORIENTATION=+